MRKFFISFILASVFLYSYAQEESPKDTTWKTGGLGSLTFSQVSLYQWSAGGEPSLSGAAILNLFANYAKADVTWENTLDLGYGLIKQGDITKKSNDRIEFTSQYSHKASEKWNYSGLINFRSQFARGYNYPNDSVRISNFMAPGYLTASVGMNYRPNEKFTLFLSPFAGKFTFVLDDSLSQQGQFGVDPGNKFRSEIGGYIRVGYKTDIMTNVNFSTKVDLFSNYLENPQNIDINWELMLAMKINDYLSATINLIALYDDDINVPREDKEPGPGWQLKEVFGLGLSYEF